MPRSPTAPARARRAPTVCNQEQSHRTYWNDVESEQDGKNNNNVNSGLECDLHKYGEETWLTENLVIPSLGNKLLGRGTT